MLGGESSNYFFQTPTVENPYWFDLNAPSHPKLPGIDLDVNSSGWFQQQQGASQKPANDDLCSLSLGFYRSNLLDCSLQLGRLNQDQNPNIAGVSTSLSLCLPENFHGRHAGTASTSQIFFSVDNDLRAEFARQEEDMTRFIQQKEAEMYRELLKIRERQTTSLANSIGRLCEQKNIQKNLELQEMYAKNRELTEKINQATAEARSWQFQAWQSQTALNNLQTELEQAREEHGENDMTSYVVGGVVGDMDTVTRCRICKEEEARILHLPCRHLSVCGGCDQSTDVCPVCFSPKTQSIEVIFP